MAILAQRNCCFLCLSANTKEMAVEPSASEKKTKRHFMAQDECISVLFRRVLKLPKPPLDNGNYNNSSKQINLCPECQNQIAGLESLIQKLAKIEQDILKRTQEIGAKLFKYNNPPPASASDDIPTSSWTQNFRRQAKAQLGANRISALVEKLNNKNVSARRPRPVDPIVRSSSSKTAAQVKIMKNVTLSRLRLRMPRNNGHANAEKLLTPAATAVAVDEVVQVAQGIGFNRIKTEPEPEVDYLSEVEEAQAGLEIIEINTSTSNDSRQLERRHDHSPEKVCADEEAKGGQAGAGLKETPFSCKLCRKSFAQKSRALACGCGLKKLNNFGEKKFECEVCSKTHARKASLTLHMSRVHAEVTARPFGCKECAGKFSTTDDLNQHSRVHSIGTGMHFRCKLCTGRFKYKLSLSRHLSQFHHGYKL